MDKIILLGIALFLAMTHTIKAQSSFNYNIELSPVNITNLPGLHSYVFGQANGKWLIIGGRTDGMHARQPFNAFQQSDNNTNLYVVDASAQQFWTAPLASLPISIAEQLQSTNMNFHQDADTLYIIGGYAYSNTAVDHITFPYLTTVQVEPLINAIINGAAIGQYFKQISDSVFALTGGQLGKIEETFYMVGGQKFDGRYNPMGHATFVQTYSNQIRKFTINNSGTQLSFGNYSAITDPVNLRRRDYNLIPQIFPDGSEGYTISSGVFQITVDLPFLYPVDITSAGHFPVPTFNQYLSNYHSAKVALYDSTGNNMHSLFFGGISQYYYQNGNLIQDNLVPFVKTISRVSRSADSTLQEFQMSTEMPSLKGASAEFILNENLPHYKSDIIKLSELNSDTILLGHIYGGISSPSLNPFDANNTNVTSADNTVYEVRLVKDNLMAVQEIDGNNPYDFEVFPNPTDSQINLRYYLKEYTELEYMIVDNSGKILTSGKIEEQYKGYNTLNIDLDQGIQSQLLNATMVFDNKFFVTKKIILKR